MDIENDIIRGFVDGWRPLRSNDTDKPEDEYTPVYMGPCKHDPNNDIPVVIMRQDTFNKLINQISRSKDAVAKTEAEQVLKILDRYG